MTVDSQVKTCYYTIKQAEATLHQLTVKTNDDERKHIFSTAEKILTSVNYDLKNQLIFLAKEEPEYE